MNQATMRPNISRKAKATGVPSRTQGDLKRFWKPGQPLIAPFMMNQNPMKSLPPIHLEQPKPVLTAVYPLAILVVEDNRINRLLVMKMLNHLGYEADAVVNGRECLQALAMKSYDLYLMDLQMPVMDGFFTTREIRRWHQLKPVNPPPYICALTANVLPKDREDSLAAGMDDFLTKPLRLEALKIVVTRVAENLVNVRRQTGQDPRKQGG
jgi:CheY-like chemotaxis protein